MTSNADQNTKSYQYQLNYLGDEAHEWILYKQE
jgi:hypothetical protein